MDIGERGEESRFSAPSEPFVPISKRPTEENTDWLNNGNLESAIGPLNINPNRVHLVVSKEAPCDIYGSPSRTSIPDCYFQPYLSTSNSDVACPEQSADSA